MKLWKIRRDAYKIGQLLGDVQAARRGPVAVVKRVERKWLWRMIGRLLRKL